MMSHDNHSRIERLIQETKDPGLQATLLVLSRLDNSLDVNTQATQAIADAFEKHRHEFSTFKNDVHKFVVNEGKLIASVRAGWVVASMMGVAILALGGYVWQAQMEAHADEAKMLRQMDARVTPLEVKMQAVDRKHDREGGR